jgi:hypothetical protein
MAAASATAVTAVKTIPSATTGRSVVAVSNIRAVERSAIQYISAIRPIRDVSEYPIWRKTFRIPKVFRALYNKVGTLEI